MELTLFRMSTKIMFLSIFSSFFAFSAFKSNNAITQEQAIRLAEEFIANNGYTSLQADTTKLSYELFDGYFKKEEMLNKRHNTLQAKAFCISEDKDRWNIGFLYASVAINKLDSLKSQSHIQGRAVIVTKNGKKVWMAHKEPIFSYFTKL